ncbi:MAG: hypothetical protein ACRD4F_10335, partial [Candidatus Angelobacter sp.]
ISVNQVKASLMRQIAPSGKAAKVAALLKHGGYVLPFTALEAGTFVVRWYQVPKGAKIARHGKAVLVAVGRLVLSGAGEGKLNIKLTAGGRKLLKHTKKVKLIVKGTFTPQGQAAVRVEKGFVIRR